MLDFTEKEIIDGVLAEFEEIAKIPRPSGHEEAVSNYLKKVFSDIGCTVVQDEKLNIIADLSASNGAESAPLTILQAHMDMVCVAAPGVEFNPLTDPVKLLNDGTVLSADGTSLGADDGIGVAEIIYIFKNLKNHGPLRAIITVDEEKGMTGAIHLDKKYLLDASYLINCDSENFDELTVGSAGSMNISFERNIVWQIPHYASAYKISLKGLLGGHSGMEIGKGRGNAIRTLALMLRRLQKEDIDFDLVEINGGTAINAIPVDGFAVIVTNEAEDKLQEILALEKENFLSIYGDVDGNLEISLEKVDMPARAFDTSLTSDLIRLLIMLHTGVYSMSQLKPSLVETSANLGILRTSDDKVEVFFFPRSASDGKVREFGDIAIAQAEATGFKANIGTQSPGWKERTDSVLMQTMNDIFQKQNGFPMQIETIHAGLECGWHFQKNPDLDIVSIGVTTIDIHSPNEKLLLESIAPQVNLITATLENIADF